MLIKVKRNGHEMQFDSTKEDVAILLTPKDKEAIEKMPRNDMLIISAPLVSMRDKAAEVWKWAMTGWKGATYVDPGNLKTKL